jgi:hypothetical protein
MFPVKPFTEPERFYRTGDSSRPPVLPRLSSVFGGPVEARTMITPEGAYRFEFTNVCIAVFARLLHSLNGVSHPKEISAPIITISITNRIKNERFAKHHDQKQVPRAIRLLPQAGCRARARFRPQGGDRVRRGASITFFPRRTNSLGVRSWAPGLYFPVCAITSISSFQTGVPRSRPAID